MNFTDSRKLCKRAFRDTEEEKIVSFQYILKA